MLLKSVSVKFSHPNITLQIKQTQLDKLYFFWPRTHYMNLLNPYQGLDDNVYCTDDEM